MQCSSTRLAMLQSYVVRGCSGRGFLSASIPRETREGGYPVVVFCWQMMYVVVVAVVIVGLTWRTRMNGGTVKLSIWGPWAELGEGRVPLRSMRKQISVERLGD